EQAVDEQSVAGHAFGELRVAVATTGWALDEEATLGTDRHDDGVLHHLRLNKPEHFSAEVFAPVRPAQAAARDRTEAQVHAFHAWRVDEDLAVRFRLRQIRHLGRIELEADVFARLATGRLVIARTQRRLDHSQPCAQDAVFIEAGDAVEQHAQ